MYLSFYGLKIKPFQINTNPGFFWLGEKQKEALSIFAYGLSKMPAILLLTGEAGTGKTTLINVFLKTLGDQYIVAKIPDPDLEAIDFMKSIADILDFQTKISDKATFFTQFSDFLNTASTLGKKVMLVIDECQRLSSHILAEIINLANIDKGETKRLKILLIGQSELDNVLQKNTSRALHQLIAINYAITPLNKQETGELIRHRLQIAGATRDIFSPDAISNIYQFSTGIPLRINNICDHALLLGFGQGSKTINGALIRQCVDNHLPRDFFNTLQNESPKYHVHGDSQPTLHIPPASRPKDGARRGKNTIGIIILLMVPVFLIAYLTDLKTFFVNPDKVHIETPTQLPDSAMDKELSDDTNTQKIAPTATITATKEEPEETVPINNPEDKSISPAEQQQQKELATNAVPKIAGKPSPTGEQPAIEPIDRPETVENTPNTQISPHSSADRPTAEQDNAVHDGQALSDTSARPDAPTTPSQAESSIIGQDIRPENELPFPDVAPAEQVTTDTSEPSDMPVAKEDKTENKEIADQQVDLGMTATIDKEIPQAQDDLSENEPKANTEAAPQDDLDQSSETIDPGAVIDWVLKKKPK